MKILQKLFLLFLLLFPFSSYSNSETDISKEGLILEYLFNTNDNSIIDTSLSPKKITTEWNIIIKNDENLWFNYVDLLLWGKIKSNIGWSTWPYWNYTISFWYKWIDKSNHSNRSYTWTQYLLNSNLWLVLWKEDKTDYYIWHTRSCFILWYNDCNVYNNIFDDKWHHIIIRKNWLYNKLFIDWKIVFDERLSIWDLWHNFEIWWWNVDTWKIAKFRLYNRDLTTEELKTLYNEFYYVSTTSIKKIDNKVWSITEEDKKILSSTWYLIGVNINTKLLDRVNNNNVATFNSMSLSNLTPQIIFSTNYWEFKDKIYLALDNNYTCFLPYWNFDCSILKDEKNHKVIIKKDGLNNLVYLDSILVLNVSDARWEYWAQLSLKNSFNITNSVYPTAKRPYYFCNWYLLVNWSYICDSKSEFLWNIDYLTLNNFNTDILQFSKIIDDETERNILLSTKSLSYNNIKLTIQNFVNDLLTINVTWLDDNTSIEKINYSYSFDGINYINIDKNNIESNTNSGFLYTINTTDLPYWDIQLFLNIKDWALSKNIWQINSRKENSWLDISIIMPDSLASDSKYISASFDWDLYMSIVKTWNICNQTLIFENYTPLTFTSEYNNWYKVCYKWIDNNTNQIVYKLSNEINWIKSKELFLWNTIFDDYKKWSYSKFPKENDTTFIALWLIWISSSYWDKTWKSWINWWSQLADINWDWLIDILYNLDNRKAILVNNWDFTFDIVYKCVVDNWYYGTCSWK